MDGKPDRTGLAFAALMALTPGAGVAGGMLMAPLQALAGIAGARQVSATLRRGWPILLFAAWVALSTLWSPVQRPEQALKIAAATVTGVLLIGGLHRAADASRGLARAALVAGVLVLAVYCLIEAAYGMPLNRLDEPGTDPGILERNPGKGVSILVALTWGALALQASQAWRRALPVVVFALVAPLTLQFHMATNFAGLCAGIAGFLLATAAPRMAPTIAASATAFWLLLTPLLTPLFFRLPLADAMPLSWRMRGEIWDFAIARIAEKPLFGWGLDGARSFGGTISSIDGLDFRAIPLHPHSVSLHVWLETGAVGALLLAFALVAAGLAASRALAGDTRASAILTATICTLAVIWNVSYGAWQEWWMATAFVALAGAMAARR